MTSSYNGDMFPPVETSDSGTKTDIKFQLGEPYYSQLVEAAENSDRSIAGQARHLVKQGLKNLTKSPDELRYPCDVKWRESPSEKTVTTDNVGLQFFPHEVSKSVLPQGGEADAGCTLAVPAKAVGKKGANRRRNYSPEFENLWKTYTKAPKVANCTKSTSFDMFNEIVESGDFTADQLANAAANAVMRQASEMKAGTKQSDLLCLPDLFRWLRDGGYEVHLESIRPVVIDDSVVAMDDPLAKYKVDPEWSLLTAEYQRAYDKGDMEEARKIYVQRETRKKQIDGVPTSPKSLMPNNWGEF